MIFNEKLLQYLWQHRLFNVHDLRTVSGEPLQIQAAGTWNTNAGPDFLNARIRVGKTLLAGNVELHLKTSDWIKHGHGKDNHYKNLILHVVYECDITNDDELPPHVPALELKGRIPGLLLERYNRLMQRGGLILCAEQLDRVTGLDWLSWKDRLLVERWQQKTALFSGWMENNQNNWAETFYYALARNFGLPVNGDAFEAVARSLPLKLISTYKHHLFKTEALLFGQAGMLEGNFREEYPSGLKEEYLFLQKKHTLQPVKPHLWRWLRMRPSAFPSLRLAEFAALIHRSSHLFSKILETETVKALREEFRVTASAYWNTHYRFDQQTHFKKKELGHNMIESLMINTICPMLAMYDRFQLSGKYLERAFQWMKTLSPENNRYTREWTKLDIANKSAWDSQALLQLTRRYCMDKRCLECVIGNKILRTGNKSNDQ